MPNTCRICSHDERAEIENAILNLTSSAPPNETNSIEKIAEDYNLDITELKAHAMFHTPLVGDGDLEQAEVESSNLQAYAGGGIVSADQIFVPMADTEEMIMQGQPAGFAQPRDSLTRKMKLREADMLAAVSNEYLVTLKTMGRRINKLAAVSFIDVEDEDKQIRLARLLTKPMTDLYIGLGGEIRQTVKTMAELDRMLNGPEDTNSSGLKALANAIANSGKSGEE